MHKKLLVITALTTGLFSQSAWCMENKGTKGITVDIKNKIIWITVHSDKCNIKLSKYITGEIKKIEFLGSSFTSTFDISGTDFKGLEKAADDLIINLEQADNMDCDSLKKAMEKYKDKRGHYPKVLYTREPCYRHIFPDRTASIYIPK